MSFSKQWLEIRNSKSYYWFVLYLSSSIGIFQSIKGFLCIWICWTDACCKTYGWICVNGTYTWQNEPQNVELHASLFNLPIINVLLFPPRESCKSCNAIMMTNALHPMINKQREEFKKGIPARDVSICYHDKEHEHHLSAFSHLQGRL